MKTVLLVGHCVPDTARIVRVLDSLGAAHESAQGIDEALEMLRQKGYALVLPNRVIGADEGGGVELIRRLRAEPGLAGVGVMLVSALAGAQAEAVAAGAAEGFGKDELESGGAAQKMRPYL